MTTRRTISRYSGLSRGLVRYSGEPSTLVFTEEGVTELERLLNAGSPAHEIADFFTVDQSWIEEVLMSPEGEYYDMFRALTADLKRRVREMQLAVAGQNAAAAKFVGMHVLGQPDKPPQAPDDPTRSVIGALPDYSASSDVWRHQFGPKGDPTTEESTIEKLRRMRRDAEDAETVDDQGKE